MNIDEPVSVELSDDGSPVRFVWRGVVYGVISAPERWFARRPWWQLDARAPRGAGDTLIVDALPLTSGASLLDGTFDLGLHPATGAWSLSRASDDVLDAQLFA
jgi:hypothetical protein